MAYMNAVYGLWNMHQYYHTDCIAKPPLSREFAASVATFIFWSRTRRKLLNLRAIEYKIHNRRKEDEDNQDCDPAPWNVLQREEC